MGGGSEEPGENKKTVGVTTESLGGRAPLRRFKKPSQESQTRVAPGLVPLVRLAAFQSVVGSEEAESSGSPSPALSRIFVRKVRSFSSATVPCVTCAPQVHPLIRFAPLKSPFLSRPAGNPKIPSAFLGVRGPSSRRQCSAGMYQALLTAQYLSVLGVSHALDGFLRGSPCGFISPHCHVQGSLFRGLLLVRSRMTFQSPLPSCRCLSFATGSCPPAPLDRESPSGLSSASESGAQSDRG